MEQVTLVDRNGRRTGHSEKVAAHRDGGALHLAFSIFVFNRNDELLLQRRAGSKYHFARLWTNTCCGHPRPEEEVLPAAGRRLEEEFGFTTALMDNFHLLYEAHDARSQLTEKEFLHVLSGRFDGTPLPTPAEIGAWRWLGVEEILREVANHPDQFTPWFQILAKRLPELLPPQHDRGQF